MDSPEFPSNFRELAIAMVGVASILRLLHDLENIAYSRPGRIALWAISLVFFISSLVVVVGDDIETQKRNPKLAFHAYRLLASLIAVGVHIYRAPIDGSLAWFHDFSWWLWAGYHVFPSLYLIRFVFNPIALTLFVVSGQPRKNLEEARSLKKGEPDSGNPSSGKGL
ncbi:hypothetical protein F4813DRAFT_367393 [Daldinia decipiens]|uniref:uncharacterized protein n=1 Tax=Daldinia decipiens TaxID=326647 RepID=UPI0020C2E1F3|nr:uncharacterized protein F4813DRAFT_367393 [Daldinia decipiens]KAI1655571.1 hypothetical protein F4813DRAFT_367393 [Daldinia decipiens]